MLKRLLAWFRSKQQLVNDLAAERAAHLDTASKARFTQVALEEQGLALARQLERSRTTNNLNMASLLIPLGGEVTIPKETVEMVWGRPESVRVDIKKSNEDGSVTVTLQFIEGEGEAGAFDDNEDGPCPCDCYAD